jgi:lysophospholipase L1-like esterase
MSKPGVIRTAVAAFLAVVALVAGQPSVAQADSPFPHPTPPHVSTRYVVLPLGDSITLGVGSSDGTGYRGPLAALAPIIAYTGSQGTPPWLHEGHSGWRIDQLAAIAAATMAAYRPRCVLLHAGTNDVVQGFTSVQMLASMAQLLDTIAAADSKALVLLAIIPNTPHATAAQQAQEAAFNAGLPALAATRPMVHLVDMTGTELGDEVHPSPAGYAHEAGQWYAALPEAMAQ